MARQKYMTEGTIAFGSLKEHDVYNGKSTGKYMIKLALEEIEAEQLRRMDVKVTDYEGVAQRKFSTNYEVDVLDKDNEPYKGPLPRGSRVRVLWASGPPHPEHGTPTYMEKVRVLEVAEEDAPEDF